MKKDKFKIMKKRLETELKDSISVEQGIPERKKKAGRRKTIKK